MARYVITFSLPPVAGAEHQASSLATRLDAALKGLRDGPVREARLISRSLPGADVARVKASMTVTVRGGLSGALEAAEAALATALGDFGPYWNLRMLSAEVRPAATERRGVRRAARRHRVAGQPGFEEAWDLAGPRDQPASPSRSVPSSARRAA